MEQLNYQLEDYCRKDNTGKINELLDKGADINIYDGFLLQCAIERNNYELAKLLIDKGINIDVGKGYLLNIACSYGGSQFVELLLSAGIIFKCDPDWLIEICITHDENDSFAVLVKYNIIKIIPNKLFYLDFHAMYISIFDACLFFKATNVLQFVINNYPEIIPNVIDKLLIKQPDIQTYNFLKILTKRNIVDIAD